MIARRGSLVGHVKSSGQKLNAEDNNSLLAEAEYIINAADEFLVSDVAEKIAA